MSLHANQNVTPPPTMYRASDRSQYQRYRLIEQIGTGGMGEVFRTHDRLTDRMVALKRVRLPSPATPLHGAVQDALRVHLTQEFQTLAGLRHPHIVRVLDHGLDHRQQPFFVMDLLDGAIPLDRAARAQCLPGRVNLLLQILQALTYLHRRGILHRDLQPSNILVQNTPHGPQVRLLDFGLALLARDAACTKVAGSVGYLAPEVQCGAPASAAADLFAVGVLTHELLLDEHPLGTRPMFERLRGFVGAAPIFIADARLGPALSGVLRRALCSDPKERYQDATVFAHELAHAAELALPAETLEIRESFIQAATFVARKAELSVLQRALSEASAGHGAIWLVGGERGVGKSRFLDELRTWALVQGTRVVRGQAMPLLGSAHQVWQGALRPLCLDMPLPAVDAAVLSAVVPDIATLIERPVPELPALDTQGANARLADMIERLLAAQTEPLVVLLEDLQWADLPSLELLRQLLHSAAFSRLPVLIVGSYRDDERPMLPSELPGVQLLQMPRLAPDEVAVLSASMLGVAGTEVTAQLTREAAGNARCITELIRTLAEEVGSLAKVGSRRIQASLGRGGAA